LFSKPLREILSTEEDVDDAAFISMDSKGTDFWVQQGAQVLFISAGIFSRTPAGP